MTPATITNQVRREVAAIMATVPPKLYTHTEYQRIRSAILLRMLKFRLDV